jgi:hypothetical protein
MSHCIVNNESRKPDRIRNFLALDLKLSVFDEDTLILNINILAGQGNVKIEIRL